MRRSALRKLSVLCHPAVSIVAHACSYTVVISKALLAADLIKQSIPRNIGEEQQGIYMNCREVEAVVYEDMGRLKIKKIIE